MKVLFISFTITLFAFHSFSQCNTKIVEQNGDVSVYSASLENIYSYVGQNDNGDYGQGVYMVNGHLLRFKGEKGDVIINEWQLFITVKSIYFRPLVPRTARIFFNDGSNITLVAVTHRQSNGHQICDYNLNESEIKKFNLGISKVIITDSRQNLQISKKPDYSYVLQEQKQCLDRY